MIRGLIEVDQGDWLVTEEHLAQRIGGSALTQGNGQAAQGLGDMKGFAAIMGGRELGNGIGLGR